MADRTIEKAPITLNDLLALGSDARVEIIDGEWVEMAAVGGTHQLIGANIYDALNMYNKEHKVGALFYDGLIFLMFAIEGQLKNSYVPDIAFILKENILGDWQLDKPYPGVPDLAIEIVSPDDNLVDVMRKRRTYLEKGTQEIWLVYPDLEEVHQYTQQAAKIYSKPEEVIITPLFPKLMGLTIQAIFQLPDWAIKLRQKNAEP